jgi:hypothetical protein
VTAIGLPFAVCIRYCTAACTCAGFFAKATSLQRVSIAAAPASNARTSMPTSAAGTSPTADSTEKRPPTPSGTTKLV